MKKLYISPSITVEELFKADVLLDSPPTVDPNQDNGSVGNDTLTNYFVNQLFGS